MSKKHFTLGGDINKSLQQGYRFNFKVLFQSTFSITRKNFLSLIVACIFTAMIVLGSYGLGYETFLNFPEYIQVAVNLIFSSFIMTPLVAGLSMMGVNHAVGMKTKSIDVFAHFNIIMKLALANMIINIIVYGISTLFTAVLGEAGTTLSLVVLLYTNVAFCLTYPLIVEKKLAPQVALRLSFRIVNKNLIQFTLLFALITLLAFAAIIPSGIGLFFFFPFYFNLMGVVYRETCGVGLVAVETETKTDATENQSFEAKDDAGIFSQDDREESPQEEQISSKKPASDKFEA